jgi:hypothetical protein
MLGNIIISYNGHVDESTIANAHLIAAAPSMYEELEDLEAWLKYHDDYKGWHVRVERLLAKARGEK